MGVNHLKDKQNITLFVTQPNRAEKKMTTELPDISSLYANKGLGTIGK